MIDVSGNGTSSLRRILGVLAIVGGITAGLAAFSENLVVILKNGKEAVLNIVQGPKRVPFEIRTREPQFVVLGTMSGEAYVEKPFLRLKVSTSALRKNRGSGATVTYVRIGLAHLKTPPGHWDVKAWSEKKAVDKTIDGFSTISIPPYETVIPIDHVKNLKDHWLVLEIGIQIGLEEITTYMHSDYMMFTR